MDYAWQLTCNVIACELDARQTCSGVSPSLFVSLGAAPASSNNLMISDEIECARSPRATLCSMLLPYMVQGIEPQVLGVVVGV